MTPRDKNGQPDIAAVFASVGYHEDECKLNSPKKATLDQLWRYVLSDPDYLPSNNDHTMDKRPDNIDWDSYAEDEADPFNETTKFRFRYYFDVPMLHLFNSRANGKTVEIRLQKKGKGEYKQVIKIGDTHSTDDMLGRTELPAQMKFFKPSLSAIDKSRDDRKITIDFLRKTTKKPQLLRPLIGIRSQRRKMEYHPEGNRDVTIELAVDIGPILNVAGYCEQIRQVELEIKENATSRTNAEALNIEAQKLIQKFPNLEVTTKSKPEDAFEDLKSRVHGCKDARKVIKALPKDEFVMVGPEKLPVLAVA